MQQNIQTPQIELVKNNQVFKMLIPHTVEEKIRIACASVPTFEWSGVLFFDYTGSFEDGSLFVTCRDILLMDIGSATYTEWAADAEVISYMAENDLLGCQMGIIHSHNTMPTFFSSTDTATLLQEGQDRNNIVSLIVNNDGKYSAAITRLVTTEAYVKEKGQYHLFDRGIQNYNEEYTTKDKYIEYFMFDIVREEPNQLFGFIDRLNQIMTKKTTVGNTLIPTGKGHNFNYYDDYDMYGMRQNVVNKNTQSHIKASSTKSTVQESKSIISKLVTTGSTKKEFEIKDFSSQIQPTVDFNKYVNNIVLQLISGNIFATVKDSTDINKFAKEKMFNLYKKRFGTKTNNKSEFAYWIDSIIDFICCNATHPELDGFSSNDKIEILAESIVERLEKIPTKNIYLTVILEHLKVFYEY